MDRETLEDLFRPFGPVLVRRMFGGYGVFADGVMFALYGRGRLFLKADNETTGRFVSEQCEEFLYERGEKTISLGYWTMPDRALDDPDELIEWSRLALTAARRKKAAEVRKNPDVRKSPEAKKTRKAMKTFEGKTAATRKARKR